MGACCGCSCACPLCTSARGPMPPPTGLTQVPPDPLHCCIVTAQAHGLKHTAACLSDIYCQHADPSVVGRRQQDVRADGAQLSTLCIFAGVASCMCCLPCLAWTGTIVMSCNELPSS